MSRFNLGGMSASGPYSNWCAACVGNDPVKTWKGDDGPVFPSGVQCAGEDARDMGGEGVEGGGVDLVELLDGEIELRVPPEGDGAVAKGVVKGVKVLVVDTFRGVLNPSLCSSLSRSSCVALTAAGYLLFGVQWSMCRPLDKTISTNVFRCTDCWTYASESLKTSPFGQAKQSSNERGRCKPS
jgi:hypothetical protein